MINFINILKYNNNIFFFMYHNRSLQHLTHVNPKLRSTCSKNRQNYHSKPPNFLKMTPNHTQSKPTSRPGSQKCLVKGYTPVQVREVKPFVGLAVSPLQAITPNVNVQPAYQEAKRPRILKRPQRGCFDFRYGRILGQGRFGNVYLVKQEHTGAMFAVKQISLSKLTPKLIQRIVSQIKIQSYINHQNCLKLYQFVKQDNKINLILQLGEQSLFDVLREKHFFTERRTAYYIRQVIKALIYLHDHGIIHRDLKPENIVLVGDVVKLADFGWSIYTGKKEKRKTFCGTLDYVSPQIVMGAEYDEMVDVWGVGILCYELCTGHAPFEEAKTKQETYSKILSVEMKFPRHLSNEVKDFIRSILIVKPEKRMTLKQALSHEWLRRYSD